MRRLTIARGGLATLLAAMVVVIAAAGPADACSLATVRLESSPTEGPPGTTVTVKAPFWYVIGPGGVGADCSGLEYPATVDIVWMQGGESITLATDVPTGEPAGSGFTTTVTVPASASVGPANITAVPMAFDNCDWCTVTFTVTGLSVPDDTVESPPDTTPRVAPRFAG